MSARRTIILFYIFMITAAPVGECLAVKPRQPTLSDSQLFPSRHLKSSQIQSPIKARQEVHILFCLLLSLPPSGFTIYWNRSTGSWALGMTAGVWFVFTLLLQLTMPIKYVPEKFALPWWSLPWVPAVSMWTNIMLVGGFGASVDDYYRLGGAMAIGSGIYLLYGVHASYYRFYRGGQEADNVAMQGK